MLSTISWKKSYLFDAMMSFWILFSLSYFLFSQTKDTYFISGYMVALAQPGLDVVLACMMGILLRYSDDNYREFYRFQAFSFIAAFIADLIYNFKLNVLFLQLTPAINSTFDLPFTLFLFLQMLSWLYLYAAINRRNPFQRFQVIVAATGPLILFGFYTFVLRWNTGHFTHIGTYHVIQNVLEGVGLFFVSLMLMKMRPANLRLYGYAYIIVIVADISIRYSVISEDYQALNPFEALWVLGLLMFAVSSVLSNSCNVLKQSALYKLADSFFHYCKIPNDDGRQWPCVCSWEIEGMLRFLLDRSSISFTDLVVMLEIDTDDFSDLKMLVATDREAYEKLWSLYNLRSNEMN